MITISNSSWSAAVNPLGAELSSLKNTASGEELIWQRDPAIWEGSAPILFPMVGILAGGIARFDGTEYPLPKHGVVRKETFEVTEQSESAVCFRFKSTPETEKAYPFRFTFEAEFKLSDAGLTVIHRVINDGETVMPFSIGAHPAIALDLEHYAIEDYYIEFNQPETLDRLAISTEGLCSVGQKNYLDQANRIGLTAAIFNDDALVFSNIASNVVSVCRKDSDWRVALETGGAPDLGIWSKPGGQAYVCIEPWYGFNDFEGFSGEFADRKNTQFLAPGKSFEQQYRLLPSL